MPFLAITPNLNRKENKKWNFAGPPSKAPSGKQRRRTRNRRYSLLAAPSSQQKNSWAAIRGHNDSNVANLFSQSGDNGMERAATLFVTGLTCTKLTWTVVTSNSIVLPIVGPLSEDPPASEKPFDSAMQENGPKTSCLVTTTIMMLINGPTVTDGMGRGRTLANPATISAVSIAPTPFQ